MLDNIFSIHVTKMDVRSREKGKKETILGTEPRSSRHDDRKLKTISIMLLDAI